MKEIEYDIEKTHEMLDGHIASNYSRLYFSSNENLPKLLDNIDIEDKKVLTVAGSGDQVFHSYNSKARLVDIFDKNKLTIYYLYLRIWVIEYFNDYYPDKKINLKYIKNLISRVKPKTEEENNALKYWKKFIVEFPYFLHTIMFMYDAKGYRDNKIKNLDIVRERLSNREFNYYNIDLSKKITLPNSYDLIIVSNIVDYIKNMEVYRDNLYGLLNENGKILATNVSYCNPTEYEYAYFSELFDASKLPKTYAHSYDWPGYVYTKKKVQ